MRNTGIGLLAVVLAVPGPAGPAAAHPATLAEARALAAEEGKPVLVDFFTEW